MNPGPRVGKHSTMNCDESAFDTDAEGAKQIRSRVSTSTPYERRLKDFDSPGAESANTARLGRSVERVRVMGATWLKPTLPSTPADVSITLDSGEVFPKVATRKPLLDENVRLTPKPSTRRDDLGRKSVFRSGRARWNRVLLRSRSKEACAVAGETSVTDGDKK